MRDAPTPFTAAMPVSALQLFLGATATYSLFIISRFLILRRPGDRYGWFISHIIALTPLPGSYQFIRLLGCSS